MVTPFSSRGIDPLNLNVTPIEAISIGRAPEPTTLSTASGFFFIHEGKIYLITNRHVVIDEREDYFPDTIRIFIHNNSADISQIRAINLDLYEEDSPIWLEHENTDVDVIAIDISTLLNLPEDIIHFWQARDIPDPSNYLDFGVNCLVIGYPLGFYDLVNNLPVTRNGSIASQYGVAFSGKPFFLIDGNFHPGTSGGPVLIPRTAPRIAGNGESSLGVAIHTFLGVHSAGYEVENVDLGLGVVWYSSLIIDIIERRERGRIR